MLKYSIVFSLLFGLTLSVFSQRKADVGIYTGLSSYKGDINESRIMYKPSPCFGVLYRYNLNPRYSLRMNGIYTSLKGDDNDFSNLLNPAQPTPRPASFNTSLIDISYLFEINFLKFTPLKKKWETSTFVNGGLGYSISLAGEAGNFVSIPFGAGVKTNLGTKVTAGAEWSFRKTYSDLIDGVENAIGDQSLFYNNDWYNYIGIFVTYKFINFAVDCPVYN